MTSKYDQLQNPLLYFMNLNQYLVPKNYVLLFFVCGVTLEIQKNCLFFTQKEENFNIFKKNFKSKQLPFHYFTLVINLFLYRSHGPISTLNNCEISHNLYSSNHFAKFCTKNSFFCVIFRLFLQ